MKSKKPNRIHRLVWPATRRRPAIVEFANNLAGIQVARSRSIVVLVIIFVIIQLPKSTTAAIAETTSANSRSIFYHSARGHEQQDNADLQQNKSRSLVHSPDENVFQNPDIRTQEHVYKIPQSPAFPYDVGNNNNNHDEDAAVDQQPSSHDQTSSGHLESNYDSFEPESATSSLPENGFPTSDSSSNNNQNNDHHHLPAPDNFDDQFFDENDPSKFISIHWIREVCQLNRGSQRSEPLNSTYLNYCNRYKLENLLSNEILMSIMHKDSQECEQILNEFIKLDELINQFDGMFKKLLTRYNCHNGYSVKWNCEDCKRAYKDWLCATNLPLYMNGERIKPCISFCERVEQRCPYLHPITKEQYGGQPVFICRDPNIPFIPEITPDIPYSEPKICYDLCHLRHNRSELLNDTLSKYDVCPDRSSIAEEVRKDPYYCGPDGLHQRPTTTKKGSHDVDVPTVSPTDGDYEEITDFKPLNEDGDASGLANKSSTHLLGHTNQKKLHAHLKRLDELREVLAVYKNQPKSHKFGHHVDHSSLSSPSINHHHHSLVRKSLDYMA